jgi:hypothetical protein
MLITVTTASQALRDILSTAQKSNLADAVNEAQNPSVLIQNLGAQDLYFERHDAATVAAGVKIAASTGSFSVDFDAYDSTNLIADGGNNTDVRVSVV